MNAAWNTFIIDYPFLRLDKYIAFDLPTEAHIEADNCFKKIFEEYHSDNKDKFQFIQTSRTSMFPPILKIGLDFAISTASSMVSVFTTM